MASTMVKGVALGDSGTSAPDPWGNPHDYRYGSLGPNVDPPYQPTPPGPSTASRYVDTGTPWVRFWINLDKFFPYNGGVDNARFAAFERQVKMAKDNGLAVIATMWNCPTWASGGGDNTWQVGALPTYRYPNDVSTTSIWASMVTCLLTAYSAGSSTPRYPGAVIDVLEVVNEGNGMMWPQTDRSGVRTAGCQAAQMMQTALVISSWFGNQATAIAGPATQDLRWSSSNGHNASPSNLSAINQTDAVVFSSDVARVFRSAGFIPGTRAVFTTHNHDDIVYQHFTVGEIRETSLRGEQWAGWPYADPNRPHLWITEGGAKTEYLLSLGIPPANVENWRALLIKVAFLRMKNDSTSASSGGYGIDLMMYYQWETSGFDCGLCEALPSRAPRPAYGTWKGL